MATDAQRKANRQNAKKSTGPRTEEGKARSSQNGLKHGLLARDAVMADEDPAEYDRQLQQLEENIFPKNALEFELVRQIADAQWRLRRLSRLEAGFCTDTYVRTSRSTRKSYPEAVLPDRDGENQLLGKSISDRTQALANLARYHTHMSRNQMRALNMIRVLRADEARYRENIDPKTGAIHRPTVTDPDPYNMPDPLEPQPTRYEPPAAVAQAPRHPIGFRTNTPSTPSAQATGSWSAYEPLRPNHETRITNHETPEPLRPRHESRNTIHEARLTDPSTPRGPQGTKQTQSRRSYLKSMGWTAYEPFRPNHGSRNTNHEALSSRSAALVGLKQEGGMPLSGPHIHSY